MTLVFVHNTSTLDAPWHQAEQLVDRPVPMRLALCGERAETLSDSDRSDSWGATWKRAIDPPGTFCPRCDNLAKELFSKSPSLETPATRESTDALLASVFGSSGLNL